MNKFPPEALLPGLRQVTGEYNTALGDLARKMLPVYAHALGIADLRELTRHFEDPLQTLIMNYFPRRPKEEYYDWNGIAMHGDTDFFTMVAQDGNPGLQIMLPSGEWAQVPPAPEGVVLVNTGEFLSRMTNHKWRNTVHKVVPPHDRDRYSLALFFSQDKRALLEPLPQFCGPENPPLYAPYSYLSELRAGLTPWNVGAREKRKRLESEKSRL